jgi:hypothetical protein
MSFDTTSNLTIAEELEDVDVIQNEQELFEYRAGKR